MYFENVGQIIRILIYLCKIEHRLPYINFIKIQFILTYSA